MNFLKILLATLTILTFSLNASVNVTKIESIKEISTEQPENTLFIFDIDETLLKSNYQMGSRPWRTYIRKAFAPEIAESLHDIFTLFLARNVPQAPAESATANFIHEIQAKGYPAIALTARERNVWYSTPSDGIDALTVGQLKSLDISFENPLQYPYFADSLDYYEGVIFSHLEEKGEFLTEVLQNQPLLPTKVIFLDDKHAQCLSVAESLDKLGIEHETYWYTAVEKSQPRFNPKAANFQFYKALESKGEVILSDEEASQYVEHEDTLPDDYYLYKALDTLN